VTILHLFNYLGRREMEIILTSLEKIGDFIWGPFMLVVPGGQLVITTPYTWLEEFTPRKNWLGATPHTGDPLDALRLELKDSFTLTKVQDLPFLLREHARKFQWCIAQATTWQRL